MLNCDKTREHLENLTATERVEDGDLTSHLDSCSDCQDYASELTQFDDRVRVSLNDVPIPGELQALLVSSLQQELQDTSDSTVRPVTIERSTTSPRTMKSFIRLGLGTVAAVVLIVCASFFWTQDQGEIVLTYKDVKETMISLSDEDWDNLSTFDNGFDSQVEGNELAKLQFEPTKGKDFDRDQLHDAMICKFTYQSGSRSWSGTLIAIPVSKFPDAPLDPVSGSSHRIAEWRSGDEKMAYICVMEKGKANDFLKAIRGGLA